MKYEKISDSIIQVFYKVYNALGYGFLEKVYENAMSIDFNNIGIKYLNQFPIQVYYGGEIIGDYIADFIVEDKIIVEIKAIKSLQNQMKISY